MFDRPYELMVRHVSICRWWALVEKSWGVSQNYPKSLPFYSNFDQVLIHMKPFVLSLKICLVTI